MSQSAKMQKQLELGRRIRARRQELDLSLRALAVRVGVTASFLSQAERGLTSPSIDSLGKIAQALDVPIFHFLVAANQKSPIVRRDQRTTLQLPDSNLVYQLLSPDLKGKLEVFLAEREPGQEKIVTPHNLETEEFIYILQGSMELELDDQVYYLEAGDTATFRGDQLRRLAARGTETLRFISVITPPIF